MCVQGHVAPSLRARRPLRCLSLHARIHKGGTLHPRSRAIAPGGASDGIGEQTGRAVQGGMDMRSASQRTVRVEVGSQVGMCRCD